MQHQSVRGRRFTWRKRVALMGLLALVSAVSACGGSEVAPSDFFGVGMGASNSAATGTTGTGGSGTGTGTGTGVGTGTPSAGSTGSGTTGTGSTGSTGTGSGTGGSTTGTGGTSSGYQATGVTAGSCAGFKNGPGITNSTITLATIADITGPVPGTFQGAMDGMNAFVKYFNATSSICGRKLKLLTYDSGLSATGSHDASVAACSNAFAAVGSESAFDSGGADVTASCGEPDIRNQAVETARQQAPTTIQVSPINTNHMFTAPWVWAKQKFPSAIKKAAFVYLNAGASETIAQSIMRATKAQLGYNWVQTIVVDIAGVPNWNAYANQLKSAGVQFVQTNLSADNIQLRQGFAQAGYNPIYMADGSAYGPQLSTGSAGATMKGAYAYSATALFGDAGRIPELQTAMTWIQRTGGRAGDAYALQSWAAGELFVQEALKLGGALTRASLLSALRGVHSFNGNGVITPSNPGSGSTAPCVSVVQFTGSGFNRVSPYPYTCGPLG